MKKILMAAAAMLIAASAFAQFQPGVGYLMEQGSYRVIDSKEKHSESENGFYLGASYNININDTDFGIAPGVYYTFATGRDDFNIKEIGIPLGSGIETRQALNIPIAFNYSVEAGPGKLFAALTPTFVFGLSDKIKSKVGNFDLPTVNLYSPDGALVKRFDIKGGISAGYTIRGIQFSLGYDYGFMNLSTIKQLSYHTSYVHIGIAYQFD